MNDPCVLQAPSLRLAGVRNSETNCQYYLMSMATCSRREVLARAAHKARWLAAEEKISETFEFRMRANIWSRSNFERVSWRK